MDVCVHTSSEYNILCLGAFLRSMSVFADLKSCNLFVSLNSTDRALAYMLRQTCSAYRAKSVSIDVFEPGEFGNRPGSNEHGEGLNRLVRRTASDLVLLADPDVLIVSPRWRGFCESAIVGRFIVGTPFHSSHSASTIMDGFPTVWCSLLDGRELRSSGVDMRPTDNSKVIVSPDTSWELSSHAKNAGLDHLSLTASKGRFPKSLDGELADSLTDLDPIGFSMPDGEVCCLHLMYSTTKQDRTLIWLAMCDRIIDACDPGVPRWRDHVRLLASHISARLP